MSIEIDELSNILYNDNGPPKIGIELEIYDEDGNISPTAHTDLYDFLLNLLAIGICKYDLVPDENNIEYIECKLQYYFSRINIHINLELLCLDDTVNYYCKLGFEDGQISVRKNPLTLHNTYMHISEVNGLYILPLKTQMENKRRKLGNNTTAIKINFNFAF